MVLLVAGWLLELWDRVVGSDPGLLRLRMASSAALGMATALGVEFGFAVLLGVGAQGVLVSMLLGAVVTMMGSMALTGTGVWSKARSALFFPVAVGIGMAAGVMVAGSTDLMLGVFVVVMFAAVYIRRFGIPFFFYGFMGWMGYFFATFLHAGWAMLPQMTIAVVLGSGWVLLLSLTVFRTNPRRTLARTVRAFDARARAVARACADLLESTTGSPRHANRARRRVRRQHTRLAEVALMVEAWSAEPGALSPDVSGAMLRRRLLDAQQLLDRMADAADALACCDPQLASSAAVVADRLARRNDAGAEHAAHALAETATDRHHDPSLSDADSGWWPARQFAVAVLEFVALTRIPVEQMAGDSAATAVDEFAQDFQPVVQLAMGYLPGSPAVARDVPARGRRWNPLARLDLTTRQAIQVGIAGGLAILAGRELSAARYYWAVIAAFIMFTGTATRSETFLKGFNRVMGTLVGLVAAVWVAEVTAGHTVLVLVVIVASVFCGFYLIRISYAYMIFFLTIILGQLYSVPHEFSPGLLVLRLEETAIGAGVASLVAVLVTPLSTRDTVRSARDNLLHTLAELLTTVADRLDPAGATRTNTGPGGTTDEPDSSGPPDLAGSARTLDDRLRQLALVARPLTRPLVWGISPLRTRHRLTLYAATTTHARALAVAVLAHPDRPEIGPAAAVACRRLAEAADALADTVPGRTQPTAAEPLEDAETALFAHTHTHPGARATDPILRPLIHLRHLLRELAGTSTAAGSAAAGSHSQPSAPAPTAALIGRISTGDGAAIAGGTVLLLSARGAAIARTHTGADGRYRISDLPLGTHLLFATAAAHQPTIGYVTVTSGQPRHHDLTLAPTAQPDGVTGAVRARDGRPLRDAGLTVVDHTGAVRGHARSGADGRYRIDLPPGEYTLFATGYPPTTRHVRLTAGTDHAVNLKLSPPERPR